MKVLRVEDLPPSSKAPCIADGCRKFADKKVIFGKKGGLFQFMAKLCQLCANKALRGDGEK